MRVIYVAKLPKSDGGTARCVEKVGGRGPRVDADDGYRPAIGTAIFPGP